MQILCWTHACNPNTQDVKEEQKFEAILNYTGRLGSPCLKNTYVGIVEH